MEKRKITEIKFSKKVMKKERDANGQLINVERHYTDFINVPVVTGWARFGHHMIDMVIYYIFAAAVAIPIVIVMALLGVDVSEFNQSGTLLSFMDRLISWLVIYPAYYILFEGTMQTSPGKLIMGRIVVDEYGEKPSFATIFKRSYSRVVPFEVFSCLGDRGWHDTWTNTYVIRKKDLKELQMAMRINEIETSPGSI